MTEPDAAPAGVAVVAGRLADYVALSAMPEVPLIAVDYWQRSAASYRQVREFAFRCAAGGAAAALSRLAGDPASPAAHRALAAELTGLLAASPQDLQAARALIADCDQRIWIDYWLGAGYRPDGPAVPLARLARLTPLTAPVTGAGQKPRTSVLIPFGDRDRGLRLRNVIACLRALRDQAPAPGQVTVTVIEADSSPRCREVIEPLTDRYVYVRKDDLFNKSWVVNVGLQAAGSPAERDGPHLTCVLDADILVDRHFLARNIARFAEPGHGAHLPFRWSLSLDEPATSHAITRRVLRRAATVGQAALRGLLLRDSPGACLWARTGLLHEIGGFDERFEGWGGEDDDVVARLGRLTAVGRFGDEILHMNHPRPAMTRPDGTGLNAHLAGSHRALTAWTGASGFGDQHKFAGAGQR